MSRLTLILALFLALQISPGFTQGWITINGIVADSAGGTPAVNHPVTIYSDSTQGFFYYNTVFTDDQGYYQDVLSVMSDSIGLIYVQTADCQGMVLRDTIFYHPSINTYTRNFYICLYNVPCQAFFSIRQIAGTEFQFQDLSTGDIIQWQWDFGDGTGSAEQNPIHYFAQPGLYSTCLTISGNNCTSVYCQEIIISDTVYQQIYGQLFAGNFPLQHGLVMIYSVNPNGVYSVLNEVSQVDSNGIYYFTLVPQGNFVVQAIPYDSSAYLPTYYGDVTNWSDCPQIAVGSPQNPYNIHLLPVPAGIELSGPGSLTGQIMNLGNDRSPADNTMIFLMSENLVNIGFSRVNSENSFSFPSLDYGTYFIRAELAGVVSDVMKFEITLEMPDVEVVLNYSGNGIYGTEEINPVENIIIYPNPATELIHISVLINGGKKLTVSMISATGQLVYRDELVQADGWQEIAIPCHGFAPGLYYLHVFAEGHRGNAKKIIVAKD